MTAVAASVRREWTTREQAYLRKRYVADGADACATALGRSLSSVYQHARHLGLHRPRAEPACAFRPRWTTSEHIDAVIRRAYQGPPRPGFVSDLASRVGRPRWWVSKRAAQLGCVPPRNKPADWSAEETALLEQHASKRAASIALIFRRHGFRRTATAISVRLKRAGFDRTDFNRMSAAGFGRMLGVDRKTVLRWIEAGLLRATRDDQNAPAGHRTDAWTIHEGDMAAFIVANAAHVDLRRITDRFWFIDLLARRATSTTAGESDPKWKRIVEYAAARPELNPRQIADVFETTARNVSVVLSLRAPHLRGRRAAA